MVPYAQNFSPRIIVCDDSVTNVSILRHLLTESGYEQVETLTDPRQVLPSLNDHGCDLLLLDLEMPHLSGYEVVTQIRTARPKEFIPILMLTGMKGIEIRNKALAGGANDFVNKPFDHNEVLLRVRNLLQVRESYITQRDLNRRLEEKVAQRTKELSDATDTLIQRLALAGELRDNETGNHVVRVGKYSRALADAYGLPPEIAFMIEKAAPMHDIGKIGIPDAVLLKQGKLSVEEMELMKSHTLLGRELLGDHTSLVVQMASSIAMTHHEKWDGSGYPNGLAGESIPPEGRITALADVFDALSSSRPYKEAWPLEKITAFINQESGRSFDPELVRLFNENLETLLEIQRQYHD